ncbi:hypothetical protein B296_00030625 [Ensete ventricosum]|uniref:Uncharacterized protein n=1 Tax=Ensete ventricosum TaxID=4639 RepID=A0A427AIL0_ENSVE|nr:hypothetical protein B296_00030625 [Ensete ventricosum]
MVEKRPRHERDHEITFKSREEEYLDHDDALMISTRIANTQVKQIMVDIGRSAYIIYFDAFQKLNLFDGNLVPMASTLTRFTRDSISPLGITTILETIKEELRTKTIMVSFMVV